MDGRGHERITIGLAAVAAAAAWASTGDMSMAATAAGGCLAGLLIHPDLDVAGMTRSHYHVARWTAGLGRLWFAVWGPYAWLIPHRHPLSHWPLLGTAGRLAYLGGIAAGVLLLFDVSLWGIWERIIANDLILVGVAGLALSDAGHWLADLVHW